MTHFDVDRGSGITTVFCPMCDQNIEAEFWASGRRWANGQLQVRLVTNSFEDHFGPCLDNALTKDGAA